MIKIIYFKKYKSFLFIGNKVCYIECVRETKNHYSIKETSASLVKNEHLKVGNVPFYDSVMTS